MNEYIVYVDKGDAVTVTADGFKFDENGNLVFFKLRATEFEDEFVTMFIRGYWLRVRIKNEKI